MCSLYLHQGFVISLCSSIYILYNIQYHFEPTANKHNHDKAPNRTALPLSLGHRSSGSENNCYQYSLGTHIQSYTCIYQSKIVPPISISSCSPLSNTHRSERRDSERKAYERFRCPRRRCREYALEDGRKSLKAAATLSRKRKYLEAHSRLEDARLCFKWAGAADADLKVLQRVLEDLEACWLNVYRELVVFWGG